MKIAVSSQGGSLNSQVAKNFGRCPYFLIVDSETMKFEPVYNPASSMTGGAGPAAARVINEKGSKIVLTGQVGPNAMSALAGYGIEAVTVSSDTVREAVEGYLKNKKTED